MRIVVDRAATGDGRLMARRVRGVTFNFRQRPLSRKTTARACQRNQAGQDRAEQRKENNGLIHKPVSPSSD
jgi:hypothetical protein